MSDLDKMVKKLREELDAEKAEAERRHEEIVAELRRANPPERERPADRLRRAYEKADDPSEVRRRRKAGTGDAEGGSDD